MSAEYCAGYVRYSTINQKDISVEYQQQVIEDYCTRNKLILHNIYVDRAQSGTTDNRPGFQEMIADARTNPVWKKVIVYDYSRFSRDVEDAVHYTDLLYAYGIRLISVTEPCGDTPEDKLAIHIKHAINQYYADHCAEITFQGLRTVAQKTKHCGGTPPLGFDLDAEDLLVINPEEAALVKKIFDMYLNGTSLRNMAKILNDEGYKTKAGTPFTKNSFYGLLKQEKYTGLYVWNKSSAKFMSKIIPGKPAHNSHRHKPIEEQIRIDSGCPQIIDLKTFQKVQELLAERAQGKSSTKARRHYFLSGLGVLKCGVCGRALEGRPRTCRGRKYNVYVCPNHIGKYATCSNKELDATYVDDLVAKAVLRATFQTSWLPIINKELKNFSYDDTLRRKLLGVERKISNVTKAIEMLPTQTLADRLPVLEQEKKELEEKLQETKGKAIKITDENLAATRKQLEEFLLTSPTPEARALLRSVIKEVKVDNDTINVTLNIA